MLYSESTDFMLYSENKQRGNIPLAKAHLQRCLDSPGFRAQAPQYADLLQRMAEIAFLEADNQRARNLLSAAEKADPESLLVKLLNAEFLGTRLGDKAAARDKCDEIEEIALRDPFPESDADFSSESYLHKARTLRSAL